MRRKLINADAPKQLDVTPLSDIFKGTEDELAAFMGQSMVITPGELVFDTSIIDGSVRYWCALRSFFADVGEIRKPPTQEEMSQRLQINRNTARTYFNMLRVARWITVLKVIQDKNLATGYSYVLHDQRMSLEFVLRHDTSYVDFMLDMSLNAKNKRLSTLAIQTVVGLPDVFINEHLTLEQQARYAKVVEKRSQLERQMANKYLGGKNLISEENLGDENLISEENLGDENLISEENLGGENLISGENLGGENLISGENLGDENLISGENLGDENLISGDIYNTARAPAHTHFGIPYGYDNTTTSSGEEDTNKNSTAKENDTASNGSCGGYDFIFFETSPIIRELIADLNANPAFGKKATHAICNLLKRKHYETKNGVAFNWLADEEIVCEMLCVLLHDSPKSATAYLQALILSAYNGEFYLKPSQQALLTKVHRRINPDYQSQSVTKVAKKLKPEEKLYNWLYANPDSVKAYKPLELFEGDEIIAKCNFPSKKIEQGVKAKIKRYEWANDENREDALFAEFNGVWSALTYGEICKAIELGVLEKC